MRSVSALLFSAVLVSSAGAMPWQAKVVHVEDGDTVTVLKGHEQLRIRLASIDAPEMSHGAGRPGQPMAAVAQKKLSQWVLGKTADFECVDEDRYGRLVCSIGMNGLDLNRRLVAEGLAWANMANRRYLRDKALPAVEQVARDARLGIWKMPSPVEPWNWRKQCWEHGICSGKQM